MLWQAPELSEDQLGLLLREDQGFCFSVSADQVIIAAILAKPKITSSLEGSLSKICIFAETLVDTVVNTLHLVYLTENKAARLVSDYSWHTDFQGAPRLRQWLLCNVQIQQCHQYKLCSWLLHVQLDFSIAMMSVIGPWLSSWVSPDLIADSFSQRRRHY